MKRHRQGTEPREVPNPRDSPSRLHSTPRPVKNQIPIQARPEHLLRCKTHAGHRDRATCQRRGYARSVSAAVEEGGEGGGEWSRSTGRGIRFSGRSPAAIEREGSGLARRVLDANQTSSLGPGVLHDVEPVVRPVLPRALKLPARQPDRPIIKTAGHRFHFAPAVRLAIWVDPE